jgi:hypothetical protein
MKHFLRTRSAVLVLVCSVAGIVGFATVALARSGPRHHHPKARAHRAQSAAETAAQAAASFPALSRTRTSSDTIPGLLLSNYGDAGLDAANSRLVVDTPDVAAWLVPDSASEVCVVLEYKTATGVAPGSASGLGCNTPAEAAKTGLVAVFDHNLVAGVLPSGTADVRVDSNSGVAPVSVTSDGGIAYLSATAVTDVKFTDPSGTSQTIDNAPPGAPAP